MLRYGVTMSKFNGVKTNNAKTNAKKEIRSHVLSSIGENAHVLEVFCGAGEMYEHVWKKASGYLGIDKVKFFDQRNTICGDALKAVTKIDVDDFTIFDIDAYGSPYEILIALLPKISRSHKKIGFVITDGIAMDLKLGRISKGIRKLVEIDFHIAKRAHIIHDDLIAKVIKRVSQDLQGSPTGIKIANGKKGSAMKYYCFIVERQ
jgi:hypothetical protein